MALNAVDWCALVKSQSCQAIITIRCSHKLCLNVCVTNVRKAVAHLVAAVAQQCDFYSTCQYYMRTVSAQCYKPKRNETKRAELLHWQVELYAIVLFFLHSSCSFAYTVIIIYATVFAFAVRIRIAHLFHGKIDDIFSFACRCCRSHCCFDVVFFHFILHIHFTLINVSINWCT